MDADRKHELVASMERFARKNVAKGLTTKTDWSAELFVPRAFLEDFALEYPEIGAIHCSDKIHTLRNELTVFRYDALIHVDKRRQGSPKQGVPRNRALDRRAASTGAFLA